MKIKMSFAMISVALIILMSGCEQPNQTTRIQSVNSEQNTNASSDTDTPADIDTSVDTNTPPDTNTPTEDATTELLFELSTAQGETILIALNNSSAAKSFYEQLPLSINVEDFGAHEKIFYPPESLDTSDTPLAIGPVGTVAYYSPWGNVAIYSGDCGGASGLYQLGQVISGNEYISQLSGTVRLEAASNGL